MWLVATALSQIQNIPIITESSIGQHWPRKIHNELLTGVISGEEISIRRIDEKMFSLFTPYIYLLFCFIFTMRTHWCNAYNLKINLKKYFLPCEFRDAGNLIKDHSPEYVGWKLSNRKWVLQRITTIIYKLTVI